MDEQLSNEESIVWKDLCATNGMAMQDWVHHACNGNYDYWYYGDASRGANSRNLESLYDKKFPLRNQGENTLLIYGDATNGIVKEAWKAVAGITNANVKRLAEATIFASVFETAFHDEDNNNLSRWSFGEYMDPAKDLDKGLMSMAWRAQSRTRLAAVFAEVDAWAAANDGLQAYSKDIDLDGEKEWILRNDKVMAVFEAEGGLMVCAWLKDGSNVWQMVGNFAAQPETGFETHETTETTSIRGAAMKDKSIGGSPMTGTRFTVSNSTGSITFKSGSTLTKTVSLADASANAFAITYSASGKQMYVRNGLSPDLATLLLRGQAAMSEEALGNTVSVTTSNGTQSATATLTVTTGSINGGAKDKEDGWDTVNMRNAAQVRDVEVSGTGTLAYTLAFGDAEVEDPYVELENGVVIPVSWFEEHYGQTGDNWETIAYRAASNKTFTVWMCYVADIDPTDPDATLEIDATDTRVDGDTVSFPVVVPTGRVGVVTYSDSLQAGWTNGPAYTNTGSATITNMYSNSPAASRFYRVLLRMHE